MYELGNNYHPNSPDFENDSGLFETPDRWKSPVETDNGFGDIFAPKREKALQPAKLKSA